MKKLFLILMMPLAVVSANRQVSSRDTSTNKNTIALLGMYHFDNPNQDQFNVQSDNVLSDKRQKEIQQLVVMLSKYRPTRIVLEFNVNDTVLDARYQRYLKDNYVLGAAETEQIGYRLARMLGHAHVYPVDVPDIRLDFNPGELAGEYGQLLEQLGKTGDSIISQINQWLKQYTIGQVLAKLNTPQLDLLNLNIYYKYLLPIGKGDNQPGAEAVARWYKRNLLILYNIMKLTEGKSGERVLVIFGQGHTAMLKQFLQYATEFVVVNIQRFLPKK